MALEIGTRFGTYEVTAELGAGGMGVVYQATDTKLEREVAIKVLPDSMAADEDRVARFDREAKTLASLNHPNIAQIHGLEESGGTTALVMELVEGPTLADRIAQGALPTDEALGVAMQIAEALEAAHSQSIVHRDLKPANIKLRPDGTVKVLDFGIAKALEAETITTGPQAPVSPMMTTPATMAGVILGTAAYMSPEQARGKPVDQRADVWAFGCVLYEMLTGQPAFGGEDVTVTLARVVDRDTDFDSLPKGISPAVARTLQLCLKKDPRERVADIRDVRLALQGAFETEADQPAADATVAAQPLWRQPLPIGVGALVVGALAAGLGGELLRPAAEPPPLNRFDYQIPEDHVIRNAGRRIIDLSPDGRHFVYNTTDGMFLRTMGELDARVIAGTEEPLTTAPTFSPDGQSIVYYDQAINQLSRIAISGGAPVAFAPFPNNVNGISWEADDTILVGQPDGIYRVPATGGTPVPVIPVEEGMQIYGPRFLPDGDTVVFSETDIGGDWDAARIVAQSLTTGERTLLVAGGSDARYLPTGHLVYALGDGLFAVRFDPDTLTVSGGAVPLVQEVMRSAGGTAAANFGIATDGTLVFVSGNVDLVGRSLLWVDRESGEEEPLAAEARLLSQLRLSPDGRRLAARVFDGGNVDVWIYDLERSTETRLTFDSAEEERPIWTPDGERIVFQAAGSEPGMFWKAADGTGQIERLTSGIDQQPNAISPDGTQLIFVENDPDGSSGLYVVGLEGEGAAEPLIVSEFWENGAVISPDGNWIAYNSTETGERGVYVRPFPNVDDGKWQIATNNSYDPIWSPDGTELFYYIEGGIMVVPVETEPTFSPGTPRVVLQGNYQYYGGNYPSYAVSPDGARFLMTRADTQDSGSDESDIVIVQNWFEELNGLAPPL